VTKAPLCFFFFQVAELKKIEKEKVEWEDRCRKLMSSIALSTKVRKEYLCVTSCYVLICLTYFF